MEELYEVFQSASNQERAELVKSRMKNKVRKGYSVSRPPFGYRTSDIPGLYLPALPQWEELRSTLKAIADKSMSVEDGIKILQTIRAKRTYTYLRKDRNGRESTYRTVKMLSNPYYCGVVMFGDICTLGLHAPLISREEWATIINLIQKSDLSDRLKYLSYQMTW